MASHLGYEIMPAKRVGRPPAQLPGQPDGDESNHKLPPHAELTGDDLHVSDATIKKAIKLRSNDAAKGVPPVPEDDAQ